MSRYLLLLVLTSPFILAAVISAITQYKLGKRSSRRLIVQLFLWAIVLVGIIFAEPLYTWLFQNNLTETEPLSLFDVVQITAIVVLLFIVNQAASRLDTLERRVNDLHQELSIRLSKDK